MSEHDAPLRLVHAEATSAGPPAPAKATLGVTPPRRRGGSSRFLTDVVVELGFADAETVNRAVEAARSASIPPERMLLDQQAITAEELSRAIAERYGLDHIDLGVFKVDMSAANLLSAAAAKRYAAVPVSYLDEHTLLLAMSDPANVLAVDDIALLTHLDVRPAVASAEDIIALIMRMNRFEDAVAEAVEESEAGAAYEEVVDLRETADDAPVIKLVHSIIAQATERGASDIHYEPQPDATGRTAREMRVRMRVDGVLTEATTVPKKMVPGVVSRIKIMADLDIAERRIPQDGRVGLTIDGRHVDVRVVTIPSVHGEGVVMRILDKESIRLELDKLGFQEQELTRFRRAFTQAYGCVLTTGPTGSGKSTSLYGALSELNTPEKNIITIEDPVEYQIAGITQVQVNTKAGLTFRRRAALDDASRPGHPDGGRDPRPRDRPDRDRGRAHRPHGPLDAAHQRRSVGDHPAGRDGDRAVPGRVRDRLRRRAATGADPVRALQAADDDPGRSAPRPRLPGRVPDRGLRARRVRALRRDGLPGTDRPVRGDGDDRGDPLARAPARLLRSARRGRRPRRNAPAARGRPRQGQARADVGRRDRPRTGTGSA